jgi:hypothetical protein
MLKSYTQSDKKFDGKLYKARKVVVDEKLLERLRKVPEAIVVSSFRTLEEQKAIVAKGASKTLQSNHRRGMAVDCVNWESIQDKMRAVGLINDISWDKNHFSYDGETKAAKYPLYNTDNSIPADTVTTETPEKKPMNKELVKILGEVCDKDFGKDLNENEQKEATNLLKKIKEEIAQNQILSQTNQSLYEENIRLANKLASVPVVKEQVALTFDPVTKGKISKGAAISIGAGTLTYLIQLISGMDYGVYTPMIVVICGIAINTLKEYVTGK